MLSRATTLRIIVLFAFHAIVFTLCYWLAWLLRFEFEIPRIHMQALEQSLPFVVGVQLAVGVFFGFYRGWWRYVGVADVIRLVFGLSLALAITGVLWYGFDATGAQGPLTGVSRGALLIDWAFSLLLLFGARVAIRVARDRTRGSSDHPDRISRVIIIGAGDAGETLAREIEHRPQLGMKVVAFVDDNPGKRGSQIRSIPIHGPIEDVARISDLTEANEALIAIPSASGKRIREVVRHLAQADLPFKTIPGIDQLVSGNVHVSQLRPVNVDDLLRRERIELPGNPVRDLFRGQRTAVTGAGGTIGAELARQILSLEPASLVLIERSEFALYESVRVLNRDFAWLRERIRPILADIGDETAMRVVFERERPRIVIHAAAHKHVPMGEENPQEYLRNNALAALRFARVCSETDVERFAFISTDKAIHPTSIMGSSKRAAEILLLDLAPRVTMKMSVVRFGNVIGSSGSVVPLFMDQIAEGGPVTVTHPDVTRYFLRLSEAVSLVLQAAALDEGGRVYMLDMGEPIRIVDLARDLIQVSGRTEAEISIVFTGLRPGEKLFEEISLEGERVHPTTHPRIVITEAPQPGAGGVQQWLDDLGREPLSLERARVVDLLRRLVPEYDPVREERVPAGQ